MNLISLAVIVAVAVSGFFVAYRLKPPVLLPAARPSFCPLPKFRGTVALPASIVCAENSGDALARVLTRVGFSMTNEDAAEIVFTRGSMLGDFSVRIAKVNLRFKVPLESAATYTIEYGAFAAFDTGDLWQFSRELEEFVERAG